MKQIKQKAIFFKISNEDLYDKISVYKTGPSVWKLVNVKIHVIFFSSVAPNTLQKIRTSNSFDNYN